VSGDNPAIANYRFRALKVPPGTPRNERGTAARRRVKIEIVGAANSQPRCERGGASSPLLPVARRPTPLTDRIMLALELASPRAAEVALPLEVIDERWGVTPYEPIARAGHARGRIMCVS